MNSVYNVTVECSCASDPGLDIDEHWDETYKLDIHPYIFQLQIGSV